MYIFWMFLSYSSSSFSVFVVCLVFYFFFKLCYHRGAEWQESLKRRLFKEKIGGDVSVCVYRREGGGENGVGQTSATDIIYLNCVFFLLSAFFLPPICHFTPLKMFSERQ